MRGREVREVEEKKGGVAAFFDLDGTLLPRPSIEWRFFCMLRYRRLVGIRNYFLWLLEAARLLPRGVNQVMHGNKMYLRGVSSSEKDGVSWPSFYPEAIARVAWHAERGHLIVIVSGTLQMLAENAARELEAELGGRGLTCTIRVCASRLEERSGRWSGRLLGDAMFDEAKARVIKRAAAELELDLERCFAYGDSASDTWMLECVGKPAAVNPSNDLARIARRKDWAILRWSKEKRVAPREGRGRPERAKEADPDELAVVRPKVGFRA